MKHRMDSLENKNKTRIRPLIYEYVHYCQPEHGIILGKYGVEEGLAEILMNSWESLNQQNNVLIRESLGDENINIFEINELCMFVGVTCDETCEVVPQVKEEEEMYKDISRRQDQNYIMMNSDAILSHEDNRGALTHFQSVIANKLE